MADRPSWWRADDERWTRERVVPEVRASLAGGFPRSMFESGEYNRRALELLDEEARGGAAVEAPRAPGGCACPPGTPQGMHFAHCPAPATEARP